MPIIVKCDVCGHENTFENFKILIELFHEILNHWDKNVQSQEILCCRCAFKKKFEKNNLKRRQI